MTENLFPCLIHIAIVFSKGQLRVSLCPYIMKYTKHRVDLDSE